MHTTAWVPRRLGQLWKKAKKNTNSFFFFFFFFLIARNPKVGRILIFIIINIFLLSLFEEKKNTQIINIFFIIIFFKKTHRLSKRKNLRGINRPGRRLSQCCRLVDWLGSNQSKNQEPQTNPNSTKPNESTCISLCKGDKKFRVSHKSSFSYSVNFFSYVTQRLSILVELGTAEMIKLAIVRSNPFSNSNHFSNSLNQNRN